MTRPQFMTNLSRKLRHRRMRRRDSPRRSWSDRVSLFTHNLTRPLRHRRMKRLNSPRRRWSERLGLLTHNLTRPLRRRRLARLNSPRSKWTVKLSQFMRSLTRPVRHVARVWLSPVRKKWHNRSLSQRTSYSLLALGVVLVVVGVAVILPNVGRVATSSFNPPQLVSGERLAARCDDPAIREVITEVVPDLQRAGMICTPQWLTLQVPTAGWPDSYVIAHAKFDTGGAWELVAIVTKNGETQFGDSELIPLGIMTRAETFASWDDERSASS